MMRTILFAMLMACLCACAAKYEDVSSAPHIRELVSTSRITKTDLLLLGIDFYPSKKRIEDYKIVKYPGFDGPEVLSRAVLPQGTKLHITGAQRCTNCSPQNVRIEVKIDGAAIEKPVYIDMGSMDALE